MIPLPSGQACDGESLSLNAPRANTDTMQIGGEGMLKSGLAALLVLATSPALAQCDAMGGKLSPGTTATWTMRVTSGKPCGLFLRAGDTARFDSVVIAARPKHGAAVSRAGASIVYRSSPGYKGEDSFDFTVSGQMPYGHVAAPVSVHVTVF